MGGGMPTVTRPKPKLVSKHLNPPAKVAPVNAGQVKAHYVGKHSFTLLQWLPGAMLTVLALSLIWAGVAVFQTANYASVGEMACKQGALPEPQILCAADDLDCLTNPTVQEVSKIKDAIRERNVSMARACISVM
jgi:hypothetical protein